MNIEELKKRITEHRIRLNTPSKACINELITFLEENDKEHKVDLVYPGYKSALLLIDSLQQAIKNIHKDTYDLQKSYKRDSEDQWKLISELTIKVEKLEKNK